MCLYFIAITQDLIEMIAAEDKWPDRRISDVSDIFPVIETLSQFQFNL